MSRLRDTHGELVGRLVNDLYAEEIALGYGQVAEHLIDELRASAPFLYRGERQNETQ